MYFSPTFSMIIADTHHNSQVSHNELNESLLNAVQHNDAQAVMAALAADKWSSLMVAANNGDATCVKLLLAAGADAEASDVEEAFESEAEDDD